jgi:CubicO group peptidase (beta-lactamase class C family)
VVGGVSAALSFLGVLWLEDHGKLSPVAPICRYLPGCPTAWQPITLQMVLAGTSRLPEFDTGKPGRTTAQALLALQGEPLDRASGTTPDYQNGDALVLSLVAETVSGQPWARFIQQTVFGPAGMSHSGRITDALVPPALALDYSGVAPNPAAVYDDTFAVYSTALDLYAYDNALFAGKLVSRHALTILERVLTHQLVYAVKTPTFVSVANLRLPHDALTVVVIGNDDRTDVAAVALHAAAQVLGRPIAPPAPI